MPFLGHGCIKDDLETAVLRDRVNGREDRGRQTFTYLQTLTNVMTRYEIIITLLYVMTRYEIIILLFVMTRYEIIILLYVMTRYEEIMKDAKQICTFKSLIFRCCSS